MVVGAPPIGHDVARFEQRSWRGEHGSGGRGRHHQPHGPRLCQALDERGQAGRARSPLLDKLLHRFRMAIINDALMAGPHESRRHIGTHSTKTEHAKLHWRAPSIDAWLLCLAGPARKIRATARITAKLMRTSTARLPVDSSWSYSATSRAV